MGSCLHHEWMETGITIRQRAWAGDIQVPLKFPEHWDVRIFTPIQITPLTSAEIRERISNPAGTGGLESLLTPGKKVLVLVDDISRPTRTDHILPVLAELLEGSGVRRDQITILIAGGTHTRMSTRQIERKLGAAIVQKYRVHQHHYGRGNFFLGRTSLGTPVYIDRLFLQHDLVIGVGTIVPHNLAGFGGGAKLILGACSIRTILHFHTRRKGASAGGDVNNELRNDLTEAARMAGMNFMIQSLVTAEREIAGIVAGDLETAFQTGLSLAREMGGVPAPKNDRYDLVVTDTYPFDATYAFSRKGWWPIKNAPDNCHKLIIASMQEGTGGHLLFPVPGDSYLTKLARLYFDLVTFGPGDFLSRSLKRRFSKRGGSGVIADDPGRTETGSDMVPVILHRAEGPALASLRKLPYVLFTDPEAYFQHMVTKTGNRPLKVAFYRAASLTFPRNHQV